MDVALLKKHGLVIFLLFFSCGWFFYQWASSAILDHKIQSHLSQVFADVRTTYPNGDYSALGAGFHDGLISRTFQSGLPVAYWVRISQDSGGRSFWVTLHGLDVDRCSSFLKKNFTAWGSKEVRINGMVLRSPSKEPKGEIDYRNFCEHAVTPGIALSWRAS